MATAQSGIAFFPTETAVPLTAMAQPRDSGNLTKEQAALFRRNLAAFRREFSEAIGRDFTSDDAAELAGMSIDTLRSYEIGQRNPRLGAIGKLAALYERPIDDFLSASPPPRPPGWRPQPRYAFKAVALDDDLRAEAIAAIEAAKRKQLERALEAKAKMRRGKKV